jgi:hypothetical protein
VIAKPESTKAGGGVADALVRSATTTPSSNCTATIKAGKPCSRRAASAGLCTQHLK